MKLAAIWLFAIVPWSAQAESPLWGSLRAGPYAVGFQSRYELDVTRLYDSDYPLDGKPVPKKPRPVLIAIWYPAEPQSGSPMVYRDYLKALVANSPVPEFSRRLRVHERDWMAEGMMRKEFRSLSKAEHAAFDKVLETKTGAALDAKPSHGRFPVIIYHPGLGGTYEDNSVLFEYLSSHGYVVISSAYQPADSTSLLIGWDLHNSFRDLNYLSRTAAALPFADTSKLAAMGHSYGAQAVLSWRAQPGSALDAVVYIDSTVEYLPPDSPKLQPLKAEFSINPKSPTPVLLFAVRKRKPHFETLDPYLAFAPRYEALLDDLDHNDFTSQGMLGQAALASVTGDSSVAQSARKDFDHVSTRIVEFLDAYLKRDSAALDSLKGADIRYRPPQPLAPTGAQLVRLFEHNALGSLANLDLDSFAAAGEILIQGSRRDDAVKLLQAGIARFPDSILLHGMLGDCFEAARDYAKAGESFRKALQLVESDATLNNSQRADAVKELKEALHSLEGAESKSAR